MLDGILNDIKTDAKASRVERLELLTKDKDVATNAHPDAMQHLGKGIIELEIPKQDLIRDSATVTIR